MVLVVDAHEADGAPEVGRPPAPGYLESQHLAIKVDGAIDIADVDTDVSDSAQMNAHAVLLASRRATLPQIAPIIGARKKSDPVPRSSRTALWNAAIRRDAATLVRQSGLAPDCRTIGAQRATSARTNAAKSAAVIPAGVAPSLSSCVRNAGSSSAARSAALRRSVSGGASRAGANTPNPAVDSKPFTTSPIAGRSGNDGCRRALVTPYPRSLPARTCAAPVTKLMNITST